MTTARRLAFDFLFRFALATFALLIVLALPAMAQQNSALDAFSMLTGTVYEIAHDLLSSVL